MGDMSRKQKAKDGEKEVIIYSCTYLKDLFCTLLGFRLHVLGRQLVDEWR